MRTKETEQRMKSRRGCSHGRGAHCGKVESDCHGVKEKNSHDGVTFVFDLSVIKSNPSQLHFGGKKDYDDLNSGLQWPT